MLTRAGDDFELASPTRDRADADAVNALLRELIGLRAQRVPRRTAAPCVDRPRSAARPPHRRAHRGRAVRPALGRAQGGLAGELAKTGDLVVTTAAALDQPLERALSDWRSRDWSSMPVFAIDRVAVADARGALQLTRTEGSWKRGDDAIDYGPVSDLLYAIDDAKAERLATRPNRPRWAPPSSPSTLAALDDVADAKRSPRQRQARRPPATKTERLELFAADRREPGAGPHRRPPRRAPAPSARRAIEIVVQAAGGARRQAADRGAAARARARPSRGIGEPPPRGDHTPTAGRRARRPAFGDPRVIGRRRGMACGRATRSKPRN